MTTSPTPRRPTASSRRRRSIWRAAAPSRPPSLRDATGTSRKYVMAILADLDRRGILRRTDAGHVPGPRAPCRRHHVRIGAARHAIDDVRTPGQRDRPGRRSLEPVRPRQARRTDRWARPSSITPSTAVSPFATEVVVVVAPTGRRDVPPMSGWSATRRLSKARSPGCCAGLAAASTEPSSSSRPGDMPDLHPAVVETLLATLATPGVDAAVLDEEGRPRPLPMAIAAGPPRPRRRSGSSPPASAGFERYPRPSSADGRSPKRPGVRSTRQGEASTTSIRPRTDRRVARHTKPPPEDGRGLSCLGGGTRG